MTPLPSEALSKKDEQTMKYWLENYHPVRQRTSRSETTKDKAGALPPAVYEKQKPDAAVRVSFPADQVDQAPLLSSEIHSFVNVSLNFVSDTNIPQVKLTPAADFRWRSTKAIQMTASAIVI